MVTKFTRLTHKIVIQLNCT